MRGEPPQIVVVVDRPDTGWKPMLKQMNVTLTIVEAFRGPGVQSLLRINGETPDLPGNVLTRLSRHHLRRLWKVHSPATLPPPDAETTLQIENESSLTRWKVIPLDGGLMLAALGVGDIFCGWKGIDLIQHEDGSLSMQPVVPE